MFSFLKKLLGRDEKFYELLEAGAIQAHESARLLPRLHNAIGTPEFGSLLHELSESRRSDKRIGHEITRTLCATFVTPLEREDIEALASALYKIPKMAEKIGERIAISPEQFTTDLVARQLQMLEQASEIVVGMVRQLRKISDVEKIQKAYERIQIIEGEADKLMISLLRDLYRGTASAKEVLVLSDIYERLERSIDLCRDAGKVIFQVALKYA
ncbi:MAG: DUF47 family protein [Puniceicoccales bacterium]|jgi:uncharacterized protein Yka (UPF0111/DUF47 family)|nr:DUF47 family protein [Puniceicoccales bacterium]